ncbi:uncharacterized protein LOC124164064 isoform X2 [Ischnura elegans]|nr:uncharacterized protein LOC124164064 isoform X2 [Ischnura elegans]
MTGNWKRAKTDELSGGEKELLSQLVEEYTTALECEPKEGDEDEQRKLMWKSLTSTFNDISSGPERTHEQLKSIWEKLNNECKGNEKQFRPRIISTSMKIEKGGNESYAEGLSWENVEASDASEMESDGIGHPIIVTDENGSYASMQVSYQDDSTPRQNVYKEGRNSNSNDSKKHSEVELRLREQLLSDQKIQLQGLKQQMELKKEILKEELEHQRRKNKMEFVHRKLLNSMERMMKQEAFRAEERRREEKHALELSILRMSSRLSPHMRWKIPGTNRNFVSSGASVSPSSSRKSTQDDPAKEADSMSSSLDKVAKPLSQEKKIILLQNGPSGETFEIVQEGNGNVVKLTD